ncbi:hypothetical protein LTR94_025011, partial [Friedmanniomyces endolithicus]
WPADELNPLFINDGPPPPSKAEGDAAENAAVEGAGDAKSTTVDKAMKAVAELNTPGAKSDYIGAVVREPILAGEPLVARKIVRAGDSGYMAAYLEPGMRAMAIRVTVETAAGGFILPGDRVDVLLTREVKGSGDDGGTKYSAATVMRNVKVLAIDQSTRAGDDEQAVVGATATLEVGPQDAEILAQAKAQGELSLSLRSYADTAGPSGSVRRASRPAAQPQTVRVYRGGAPEVVAPVAQNRTAVSTGATQRLINLPRGTSFAVDLPADARDVIVSNPQVAEAMLHSPRRITVIGVTPGETDAVFLDAAGRTILSLRVRVDAGTSALQDTLSRVLPGANVHAEAVNDSILLTGAVASPFQAEQARRVATAFVSAPEKVINLIGVTGSDQVTVKARIVEVERSVVKQLGTDVSAVLNTVGDGLTFSSASSFAVNGNLLGGGGLGYTDVSGNGNRLSTSVRAFERAGLLRTLAEPNLTSVNGENAEFLAGGEFPVPVGLDDGSNGRARVGVEFKPYGVRLAVRPIVQSEGRISLQLSTEVSELSSEGAFTVGAGDSTLVIPGLTVRRASTTVELPSGGSLMIAGLLSETTRQNLDKLPGLGEVPVLGALFRSRDYQSGETELVILIEAYLASPTAPGMFQTPADGLQVADDAQTILFGQLSQRYGTPSAAASGGSATWSGSVGYVIE